MPNPNAVVDGISNLSPSQEALEATPLEAMPQIVTVNFQGGRSGLLDMTKPLSRLWAKMLDFQRQNNMPAYVEIDPETNVITQLLIPEASRVWSLTTTTTGDVEVKLVPSHALHYLRRANPDFDQLLSTLQSAKDEESTVLVTWTWDKQEIIDVRSLPEPLGPEEPPAPPGTPPSPGDVPPVTSQRAQELFDLMDAKSCDPCTPGPDCIPFKYPTDGCYARAHEMCRLMFAEGEQPEKIWIYGNLKVETSNDPDCQVGWWYHVAPTLLVTTPNGPEIRVIDPSLCRGPVSKEEWKDKQGDQNADFDFTNTEPFMPIPDSQRLYTYDEDYSETKMYLQLRRNDLEKQCMVYGQPPYRCPITKNCFFMIDKSSFGEYEVAALLQQPSPAVFDNAFYVVVDGFTPAELGIKEKDFIDPPDVVPDFSIDPTVQGMFVKPTRLAAEDPSHLMRRQLLRWTYQVEFTNTEGFEFEDDEMQVTLKAEISGEKDTAYIRLIKQPNPYEIDGPIWWLSTDLRVFQIKRGESKFGVKMGDDAPTFIQEVITNLNTDTAGDQTFDEISTDLLESQLELSMTDVNGTPVFNFAVARVRYRSLELEAKDVRVFFRLFPVSTTSIDYNKLTTYRRWEPDGVKIPLLGIQDGELVTIPCFAAPRVDTSLSLTEQTDPANVRDIPADDTGAVQKAYFGCWLDINQLKKLFPMNPPADKPDGPFETDQKTIQELIRGKHQCLVAEIAFDLAPIPDGASPGSSDKLAQRNLSIIESANPGNIASRCIPLTFDIRPTRATLQPDEVPDELMIDWGNTPVGSRARLYLPGIRATEVIEMARGMYRTHQLDRVDDHTLQCQTGGVTYVPIPPGVGNRAGLLLVDLPETVRRGQMITIVVRQVTSVVEVPGTIPIKWRRIIGTFQITIPVRAKETVREPEARLLSVLRWIQGAIPEDNRWFPVFHRYVDQIAGRVDAFGGDSSKVVPSPSGNWKEPDDIIMQVEGDVTALFESKEAGFENEFWLHKPQKKLIFKATDENVGKKFRVGHFRELTRLVFALKTQDGHTYYTDRSLNQDGCVHVIRTRLGKYAYRYEWEDIWELGDRDFNDLIVKINITLVGC